MFGRGAFESLAGEQPIGGQYPVQARLTGSHGAERLQIRTRAIDPARQGTDGSKDTDDDRDRLHRRSGSVRRFGVNVGVKLGRIGLGIVGGELGGLVDDVAHLGVDLLDLVLGGPLVGEDAAAHLLDRIVLVADLLDFLAGAFAFALSLIATKQLTANVGTFTIVFWMNALQFPVALLVPVVLMNGDLLFMTKIGWTGLVPAIALGASGLASHYCLTNAFRSGDASVVVPIDFLRIPLIAVVGYLLYGESIDVFVFLGAALIICGVLWNLRAETRKPGPPPPESTKAAEA